MNDARSAPSASPAPAAHSNRNRFGTGGSAGVSIARARTTTASGRARLIEALVPAVWLALVAIGAFGLSGGYATGNLLVVAFATISAVLVGTVWLGALRSLLFVVLYPLLRSPERRPKATTEIPPRSRVAILSCSANDFDESTLRRSMEQSYPGVETIILDDSTDPAVGDRVDAFAEEVGARVVRRENRVGYKAGNLNHYFASGLQHDFYAIVDSDETLPVDFVELALRRFVESPSTGVVQGSHRTIRGKSAFADEFGALFETHLGVTQAARSRYGFSMFMGRGALVSADCIRDAGAFPEVVAEDIAFSLRARTAGYDIVYAPEIVSSEDYPIDYHAFRKQHGKFVQGSTEYIARYGFQILRSPLRAGEKADLLLESSAAPAAALLAVVMFALTGVESVLHVSTTIPGWVGATLGVCGLVPLLPDVLRRLRRTSIIRTIAFLGHALALYGSTLGVTVASTFSVMFGRRAVFTITPKLVGGSWRTTVLPEIHAALAVGALSLCLFGTLAPAGAFGGAAVAAAVVAALSAHRGSAKDVARDTCARSRPSRAWI